MPTLRFGRKLSLPSTIAIKHQVRTLMAQYELKKAETEAKAEVVREQPSLAVLPAMPVTGVGANKLSGGTRLL
jgi:hypothetical protein